MLDCSSLWRFAAVRLSTTGNANCFFWCFTTVRLSTTGNANCFFGVSLPSAYPQREMRTEKQSKPRQLGFFYTLQVRNMDIKFYYVNPDYIEHLKKAEIQARKFTCVPNVTYANRDKFFYGAVIKRKNGMCYYVPISSQAKNDANSIIIKTNDKINNIKGSLRFAYMIPVPREMLISMNFNDVKNQNRKTLLQKELAFCRRNKDKIINQATKSFTAISQSKSLKLKNNACDFEIPEKAYIEFCQKNNLSMSGIKREPKDPIVEPKQDAKLTQPNPIKPKKIR